ncbi:MAG: glycosyltransferase family 2 protein [Acidimicrobiales bacterium]|nr:glycosyltransferase family 2 protein [Acidimicrobiales bacterium]
MIIPTYQRAGLVARAVDSALAGTRDGDEVIVVDDGSTDDTADVLAQYSDPVRYLRVPRGGAGRARNHGVRAARGTLVAFLDSDDEWDPDKLDLQRAVMDARPDVVFSFTDFASRHEGRADGHHQLARWHGSDLGWDALLGPAQPYSALAPLPAGRDDFPVHVGDLYPRVLSGHFVPTFTMMVRRAVAGDALWFAEDLPTYEDLECHARLARVGPAAYLDAETAYQWGHASERLTDADSFTCASARLTIVERVYGADPEFLASHADEYEREVRRQHLTRARWLLARGRSREARAELRAAGGGPLAWRFGARLPEGAVPRLRSVARRGRTPSGASS